MTCVREPNAEPIPGYRLVEPLGSGGFGEVWKCEAPGGLFKAIKFVYGNLNSLDVDGVRAEQELQALQCIKEVRHPFVLSLDRIETVNGELVIVMELADKSLHDAFLECQSAGLVGIPRETVLRYLRDASEALDHMNEKHNLQHLDIKPRNLFLISDRVKVADFGLVKTLERQTISGLPGGVTPLYAAPETFTGKISERSDQYSLAIVYQELVTGHRPFTGKNARQLAQQHMQAEPELRSLPEAERPIIARALAKDPANRFPNCLALIRALYSVRGRSRLETAAAGATRIPTEAETTDDVDFEDASAAALGGDATQPPQVMEEISRLGLTMAQPDSGALRPTVIIGIGSFGRRALRELRCRFLDRLGDLDKIPLLRFLYVDADAEAINEALRGTPEVAFARSETYHLPLQPVGHYRRRTIDHLSEWLPREKLYSIPRSLQTQGSRALGRLAFVDNHLRLLARLRREVQQAIHPDSVYQSVSQTGLALRDPVPRICVIAAAGGGSSGLLTDLGYSLRRLLQQLRHPEADVNLFLFCGAPTDPATSRTELANVYATLTELNHFGDPSIPFAAQYGPDGPRIVDNGQAYSSTYLLQLTHRSPEALRDAVAHLGSYLFHELTTPLGLRLDRSRQMPPPAGATSFRSLGTYAVWFPRGLLLRLAARHVCQHLLEEWRAEGEPSAVAEVDAAWARIRADAEQRLASLGARIEEAAQPHLGGLPAESLTALLGVLEEQAQQSVAQDDPGNWARQAVGRVRAWMGALPGAENSTTNSAASCGDWRRGRLDRALTLAAERQAEEWDEQLTSRIRGLMEHPGRRLAAAEAAWTRCLLFGEEAAAHHRQRCAQQAVRTQKARQQLESALENCLAEGEGGSWGLPSLLLFGNRSRRLLRVFMDHLSAYARQCLVEAVLSAEQLFFALLQGRLEERLRDLRFCAQRLRYLQECLEASLEDAAELATVHVGISITPSQSPIRSAESFWESIRQSTTIRVVLPGGEEDLERAAAQFAAALPVEPRVQLDQALQDHVLAPRGGLQAACADNGDLVRGLAMPLLDQAANFLSNHLPVTDVAEVELAGQDIDLATQLQIHLDRATPMISAKDGRGQDAFLLVPASEAGKRFGEAASKLKGDLQLVRVPGQAHLMFCREQSHLLVEDLQRVFQNCRAAYESSVLQPLCSPHARFDLNDWIPLDP